MHLSTQADDEKEKEKKMQALKRSAHLFPFSLNIPSSIIGPSPFLFRFSLFPPSSLSISPLHTFLLDC